jgi:single-strand DNA-binding protein
MAGDTTITIIGNLTDDPELKFTSSGVAVAKFRVASTPRFMRNGEWKDGDPLFMACNVWRQAAENVAESLQRGARVVVVGRLRQRSYETQSGEKRTVLELEVDEVAPSLRYATAKVQKMTRGTGNGSSGGYGSSGGGGTDAPVNFGGGVVDDNNARYDDPWASAPLQGASRRAPDHGRDPNAKYDPEADDTPPF